MCRKLKRITSRSACRGRPVELLGDRSPALLRGSEEATMAKMFGYRGCDFAYRFLTLLTGRTSRSPLPLPAGTS
jgi:hypothetical protein